MELIYLLSLLLTGGGVFWQTEKEGGGGLRCGHNPKRGFLCAGPTRKNGSLIGAVQVKKGGGYTPIGPTHIYICECPPPTPQARHRGVFPIQFGLNSRGGYRGPPLN